MAIAKNANTGGNKGTNTALKQSVKTSSIISGVAGALMAAAKAVSAGAAAAAKAAATQSKKKNNNNTNKKTTTTASSGIGSAAQAASNPGTTILLEWCGVKFFAKAGQVVGFHDLTISGSCETEDKEGGGQKYVALKNKKGFEIGFTAYLDKRMGVVDPRADALALAGMAAEGKSGYVYCRESKLVAQNMMATSGKVKDILMTPDGKWICCQVEMTLKGCSKLEGASSGDGGTGSNGPWTARVYYSTGSGAMDSVTATSTVSYQDALAKAYKKVPNNAMWAGTTKQQAEYQDAAKPTEQTLENARDRVKTSTQQSDNAKDKSTQTSVPGITDLNKNVQQQKNNKLKPVKVR